MTFLCYGVSKIKFGCQPWLESWKGLSPFLLNSYFKNSTAGLYVLYIINMHTNCGCPRTEDESEKL